MNIYKNYFLKCGDEHPYFIKFRGVIYNTKHYDIDCAIYYVMSMAGLTPVIE